VQTTQFGYDQMPLWHPAAGAFYLKLYEYKFTKIEIKNTLRHLAHVMHPWNSGHLQMFPSDC